MTTDRVHPVCGHNAPAESVTVTKVVDDYHNDDDDECI